VFKHSARADRKLHWPKITRDGLLFSTGLALTINEAAIQDGPTDPLLLMMFAGMMGLPVFLGFDEKKKPSAQTSPPLDIPQQEDMA
jgi:hypothetical protein